MSEDIFNQPSTYAPPPPARNSLIDKVPAPAAPQVITPRPYQQEAIDNGLNFLHSKKKTHEFQVVPTGGGKSIIIANIAKGMQGDSIVLQPSVEILEQNYSKLKSYGYNASIYSASYGEKKVSPLTYCMIGSIINKLHLFRGVKNVLIDECHAVNSKESESMYNKLITYLPDCKVLGFTATPYRLSSSRDFGSMLKFLNRTRPAIFKDVNYVIQNRLLFDQGYLAKLEYYTENVIDRNQLTLNSNGTDFTENSVRAYFRKIKMPSLMANFANRILSKRKNLLVFCSLVDEANQVAELVPGAIVITGETPMPQRTAILNSFKAGRIKCLVNIGVLVVGFDFPQLEAILIGRSTMSLAWYYQAIGRGMRIHPDKSNCWIIDIGANYSTFGKIEDLEVRKSTKGLYSVWNSSNNRMLTNVAFTKH